MLPALLQAFCPLTGDSTSLRIDVPGLEHWTITRYATAAALRRSWPEAEREDDFWISPEVLTFLTDHPQGLKTEAVLLEDGRNGNRVLLTAQTFSFSAAGQVSEEAGGEPSRWNFRRRLLAPFSFKVLCLGQFLTSGDFAAAGLERLDSDEATSLLPVVAETLMRCHAGYAAYLIKDLYPAGHPVATALESSRHHPLPADPVMQLELPAAWKSVEDYLAALTSKYRVRYRRARGKLEGITRRRMGPEEVEDRRDRLYELYRAISAGADFNAAALSPAYFPWLVKTRRPATRPQKVFAGYSRTEEENGENARCPVFHGYFNAAEELIGFTTAIPNGKVLHAHFLGFEEEYNRSHHLYHNMLFDLLDEAIAGNFRTLDYGRTALEIKSSVGAAATDYAVLVKARYAWLNRLVPLFTPAVYQAPEWGARSPFK